MKMLANVKLSPHKYKSPEGYLICQDCIIARTGAQTYLRSEIYDDDDNGNEFIDINRSEEQVFDPKTIASFENKPLTIEHPDNSVNPSNYKSLAVGNVHNVHKGEYEGEPVMYADIVVFDAQAIDLIESGEMVELSCGYDCDITDGPNPEQINIRGNHVALCEQGRAGIARIQDSKSWGAKPVKDSIGRGTLIQEFGKQGKQYKIQKIIGNVIYAESLENERIVLFKKDEENIEWATITKSEVKDSISDKELDTKDRNLAAYEMPISVQDDIPEYIEQFDLILTTDKCWDMTLNKVDAWIFEKYGCNRLSVEEIGKRIDEGKLCLIPIVREYGNIGESQVKVLEIGPFHSMEEVNKFANGELKSFIDSHKEDKKEHIIITIKKDVINLKDLTPVKEVKDEEPEEANPEYLEAYNEMFDHFNSIEGVSTDLKDYETKNKLLIFDVFGKLDWNKEKEYIRGIMKKHNQKILWTEEEEGWYVITTPVEHTYVIWYTDSTPVHDAESHHYIIVLEDGNNESAWLDEMDRPTNKIENAKKFASYEEADSHRKTYCKGAVQEIKDSKIDMEGIAEDVNLKKEVEMVLENVKHGPIKESWGSVTVDFENREDLRKAARKLIKLFDIELFEDDEDDPMYIAVYEKLKKSLKDSLAALSKIKDAYSKRFYTNAIKQLEAKLEKLEKNELLDSNQQDYEKQKNSMKETIKSQIEEYKKKLGEYEAGDHE